MQVQSINNQQTSFKAAKGRFSLKTALFAKTTLQMAQARAERTRLAYEAALAKNNKSQLAKAYAAMSNARIRLQNLG